MAEEAEAARNSDDAKKLYGYYIEITQPLQTQRNHVRILRVRAADVDVGLAAGLRPNQP